MKIIAMVPVRNEAWVLPHSLACLSGFCDVILISDRESEDRTREICRQFSKVVLLEAGPGSRIRQQRWQLLDAARDYDGHNLLWSCDADELLAPRAMTAFVGQHRQSLAPGIVVEARLYTLWNTFTSYRNDDSIYKPHWKRLGFVDDRRADYDRSDPLALHEPRIPADERVRALQAADLHVLHLQYLIPVCNQMKQAWYRCREWLDRHNPGAGINCRYSMTLPVRARTAPVPPEWTDGVTFPDPAADRAPSWHQRELFAWFDQQGIERFEPLEIWYIDVLQQEFRRRTGRRPRPDRSYVPRWTVRARKSAWSFAWRAARAARRRLAM